MVGAQYRIKAEAKRTARAQRKAFIDYRQNVKEKAQRENWHAQQSVHQTETATYVDHGIELGDEPAGAEIKQYSTDRQLTPDSLGYYNR